MDREDEDHLEAIRFDFQFHRKIVDIVGNTVMSNVMEVIHEFVMAGMVHTTPKPRNRARSRKLHGDILQAIRDHDPEAAEYAMKVHMGAVGKATRRGGTAAGRREVMNAKLTGRARSVSEGYSRPSLTRRALKWVFFLLLAASEVRADSTADEFFEKDVRPLLVNRCQKCHSDKDAKGGLNLTLAPLCSRAARVVRPSSRESPMKACWFRPSATRTSRACRRRRSCPIATSPL